MRLISDIQYSQGQTLVKQIRTRLKDACGMCSRDLAASIETGRASIEGALRQFDSAVMIVVAVGMLKAGKSTLINLLARNPLASPTGFGTDTTLRPALVTMGEKGDKVGSIMIYGNRPAEREAQHRLLLAILDNLRGLPTAEGDAAAQPVVKPLNSDMLKSALCKPSGMLNQLLPSEPMLVVVKLPWHDDAKLLQDGRMLLDMPGLDSANAEISLTRDKVFTETQLSSVEAMFRELFAGKSEGERVTRAVQALREKESMVTYESLIQQCDMVLCLQSSVSPLNEKACDCLNTVLELRSGATAWIVMNRMRNQDWLTADCQSGKWQEQERQAGLVFSKIRKGTKLNKSACNLGEAYAGILEDSANILPDYAGRHGVHKVQQYLLEKSGFPGMEEQLLSLLDKNGQQTRRQHCKENLENELGVCKDSMQQQLSRYKARISRLEGEAALWDKAEQNIVVQQQAAPLNGVVECLFLKLKDDIRKRCQKREDGNQDMKEEWIYGSVIDDYLDSCFHECHGMVETFLEKLTVGDLTLRTETTSGEACRRSLSDILNDEIGKRFDEYIQGTVSLLDGVEEGEALKNELAAAKYIRVPLNDSIMDKNAAAKLGHYVMQHAPYAEDNANRRSFLGFSLPWAEGRQSCNSKIWRDDIENMIGHYLEQITSILNGRLVNPKGDTRCAEIIRSRVASALEPVRSKVRKQREHLKAMLRKAEANRALAAGVKADIEEFLSKVNQW